MIQMNLQLLISAIVLGLSMSGVYFLLTVGLSLLLWFDADYRP